MAQGAYAGRVLLEKRHGQWQMRLCSGDGLKDVKILQQTGVDAASARRLSDGLQIAEAKLSLADRNELARFRGTVQLH
ncbi:copper uptake system-associated protein [Lysobacter enzymogenes]|uniref:copper uptake system-associated protein n=1 Tax=Lysobacter enzymogenes TaxID=69 RepID=UPI003D2F8606